MSRSRVFCITGRASREYYGLLRANEKHRERVAGVSRGRIFARTFLFFPLFLIPVLAKAARAKCGEIREGRRRTESGRKRQNIAGDAQGNKIETRSASGNAKQRKKEGNRVRDRETTCLASGTHALRVMRVAAFSRRIPSTRSEERDLRYSRILHSLHTVRRSR